MSIDEVARRRAFEPTTDPVELARSHQALKQISDGDPDGDLFRAITGPRTCAAELRGPAGAGKSSCIMRVLSHVAGLTGLRYELLLLRAADDGTILESPAAFAAYLIDVIRSQGFRFAAPVQEELSRVGAAETVVTDPVRTGTRSVEGHAKVVSGRYERALQDAFEQRSYGRNAAQSRQELEGVLAIIRDHGVRPMIVVDDTDKFAEPASVGVDTQAVDGLFDNGVRTLSDLGVDFVVAVHPRFEGVGGYDAAAAKFLTTRLEIPWLLPERAPIAAILDRHLKAHGIDASIEGLVTATALAALWGIYSVNRNVRDTLNVAHRAAANASERRSAVLDEEDVGAARRPLTA